ncbi:AAA family ATPase [Pseudonocardia sp.]|uniref:helix-turn-helix transcriptional regulator n=1 Tax=Pseudonocardia sp. TaxID=60912 RepID=UPI003D099B6D
MRGRAEERETVDALLADAANGRAGVLEIVGEPGIGKTALCDEVAAAAARSGVTVLRVLGVQGESDLPLAALYALLRPLRGLVPDLPRAQRDAVVGLLDGGTGPAGDVLVLGGATLSLIARAAEDGTVLVLVDDAHWVDDLSGTVLAFAFRRLGADSVAVVVTTRPVRRRRVAGPWPSRVLPGLSVDAVGALLGPQVPRAVAGALRAATDGNPLVLSELARTLTAAQLAGRVPLPDPLPLGERGTALFGARLAGLPPDTRLALAAVAAAGPGGASLLPAALADLGLTADRLAPAERSGLLVVGGSGPAFPHPLVRAAAYGSLEPATRRRVHRALAHAGADGDAQRHALHLAAAVAVPDEEVAAALDRAAEEAERRGGPAAGAAARTRAAELSPEGPARDRRRVAAAEVCLIAGRRHDAERLVLDVLATGMSTEERRRALALRASAAMWTMGGLAAVPMMRDTMDELAGVAPELAALVASQLSTVLGSFGRLAEAAEISERATHLRVSDPVIGYLLAERHTWGLAMMGDLSGDNEAIRRYPHEVHGVAARSRFPMHPHTWTQTLMLMERFAQCRADADSHVSDLRRSGSPTLVPYPLMVRADVCFHTGELQRAKADLDEAIDLDEQFGFGLLRGFAHALRLRAAAFEGDQVSATALAAAAAKAVDEGGQRSVALYRSHALGLLELGLGRPAVAAEHLAQAASAAAAAGLVAPVSVPWQGDRIEALHGAGRGREAREALAALEDVAARTGSRWARSVAARCRALLGDAAWPELYTTAMDEQRDLPVERARTALLYGSHLRRARRLRTARDVLAPAVEELTRMGARPWAERARAELRAAGGRVPSEAPAATTTLTAQELRVCLAVAEGATNRETAEMLFLSPKTVEYHLGRVFTKLGVGNRAQLTRLVVDGALTAPEAR